MKTRITIAVLVIIAVLTLFTACSNSSSAGYKHLEPDEAADMISAGDCILVDCRSDAALNRSYSGFYQRPYNG